MGKTASLSGGAIGETGRAGKAGIDQFGGS